MSYLESFVLDVIYTKVLILRQQLNLLKFVDVALLLVDNNFRLTANAAADIRLCCGIAGLHVV